MKPTGRRWIALGILLGLLFGAWAVTAAVRALKTAEVYSQAEQMIAAGEYERALDQLDLLEKTEYKDKQALIRLCRAHQYYERGSYASAYRELKGVVFRYVTAEQKEEIAAFRAVLYAEYQAQLKREEERKAEEYEKKITEGVPFVGMPESRISDTSLGRPSEEVRHNSEMIDGERYTANLYDFYRDGRLIFCARCIRGKVTAVWDYRDSGTDYDPSFNGCDRSYYITDEDVQQYSHPDDFYYDYPDDFVDFEDAEDYYYSHGGR